MELATSLAAVALYDIVIYADDSGSMIFEENGERINDLKLILGRVSEVTRRAMTARPPRVCCGAEVIKDRLFVFNLLRLDMRLCVRAVKVLLLRATSS